MCRKERKEGSVGAEEEKAMRLFRQQVVVVAFALAAACSGGAAKGEQAVQPIAHFHDFAPQKPDGWETWSPRPEIAPRFAVDAAAGRTGHSALKIEGGGNSAAYGAWRRRVGGVAGGKTYRFTAWYRAQGVPESLLIRCVSARLDWLDEKGQRARPPDYALDAGRENGWTKVEYVAAAPENARSVVIELAFMWSKKGAVWWDDIRMAEEPAPPDRVVRAVTVFHRPSGTHSAEESVAEFCRLVESAAPLKPDIICLPEGITVVGNGKSYVEVSEPVPGPTTRALGALAQRLRCYIAAGLFERVGPVVYNTSVLVGRDGKLAGAYRKTHLPREEVEGGITPGDSYPVFETDFGKVGMMICWDVQFPEPARAMALKGAEILLLPIWGGSETLARARAIENHAFLLSSSYDMKTFIVAPDGAVLAEATAGNPLAFAELHLDRKIIQPWLGDMKPRTWKERRPDISLEPR
jgi:predicted amidohydrolase